MQVRRIMLEIPVDLLCRINSNITKPRDLNAKILKCVQIGYSHLVTPKTGEPTDNSVRLIPQR